VEISLAKVNKDFESKSLQYCGGKNSFRNHSLLLKNWEEKFFEFYFQMQDIPRSEVTSFKKAVTNYMAQTIRFGLRNFLNLKDGHWTLSKSGSKYCIYCK